MGHSQAGKTENRERILDEASRQVRRDGLDAVSVGSLMKSVGLTHGGFYGHFESRSALLAEAVGRALHAGEARAREGSPDFPDFVRSYLSGTHRDARESGCAVAALVSDVGRADESVRTVMQAHVETLIQQIAAELGGDEAKAMTALSAMIGGLALSRVFSDEKRADVLLKAVRDSLLAEPEPCGESDQSTRSHSSSLNSRLGSPDHAGNSFD